MWFPPAEASTAVKYQATTVLGRGNRLRVLQLLNASLSMQLLEGRRWSGSGGGGGVVERVGEGERDHVGEDSKITVRKGSDRRKRPF